LSKYIDLNCDMGESFGVYMLGYDEEALRLISSANIACGIHAGDPNVMDTTVRLAKAHNVGIGAHPGFPDLMGFGRRNMELDKEELINLIIYQIGATEAFCAKHNVQLQHVKPHGSMYNMSDHHRHVAEGIVEAIHHVNPELLLFAKPDSLLHKVAAEYGVRVVRELFADRAYHDDLTLVSRKKEGAVIHEPAAVARRVVKMVKERKVTSINGQELPIEGQSICVHGDTPQAVQIMHQIRMALDKEQVEVNPAGEWIHWSD
jgi:5-oxoprolinase (ATP-hydrolysing) subunit A